MHAVVADGLLKTDRWLQHTAVAGAAKILRGKTKTADVAH